MSINTDSQTAVTCPVWCSNTLMADKPCTGEHYREVSVVPATGSGFSPQIDLLRGATFPLVGAGLYFNEEDGEAPSVTLFVMCEGQGGRSINADWHLTPEEARRLAMLLLDQVAQLDH